jgi:hypothetical protein
MIIIMDHFMFIQDFMDITIGEIITIPGIGTEAIPIPSLRGQDKEDG